MTISSLGSPFQKVQSNGGSTYSFGFQPLPVENGSSIYSVKVSVWNGSSTSGYILKVQGPAADYTVSTTSSAAESGQITFTIPVPTGQTILIESEVPYTQIISFPGNAPVSPVNVEKALDRLEMQIRQLGYLLTEAVRLEHPSIYGAIKLLVDGNVLDGATVYWEKDSSDPTIYRLKTSDFTISELKTLVTSVNQIKTDVDAALAAARAANDSAILAANNAAASAQAATNTINALQQIEAEVQLIKGQVNDLLNQVIQLKAETVQLKTDTSLIKDQAVAAKDAAIVAQHAAETLVAKYPDPTGRGAGLTMVTKADDTYELKPYQYFQSLIGAVAGRKLITDGANGILPVRDSSAVTNIDSATIGDIITVGPSPNGNILIAGPYVSSTASISTVSPVDEGGVTVNESLIGHELRLDALEALANPYPFGEANVVMDLRVLRNGVLRNQLDQYVVAPQNTATTTFVTFGKSAHFTTDANYSIQSTKDTKDIFKAQSSIVFSLYVDSSFNVPAAILQNPKLLVEVRATVITVTYDTRILTIPLVLNEWRIYCLSFNDLTLKAFVATYTAGSINVDDTIAPLTLAAPLTNNPISISAEDKVRLASFGIISVSISKDDFENYSRAFYGLKAAGPGTIVPDPTTGLSGQAVVTNGASYVFKYPILVGNLATGYNFQNQIDATLELANTSEYEVFFQVDTTTKLINAKVRDTQPSISVKTQFYTGTISNVPTILAPKDLNVKVRTIQNLSDVDITFGAQADLTTNPLKGYTLAAQTSIQTFINDVIYVTAPAGSVIPAESIKIVDEVTAIPNRQVSPVTTLPAPPTPNTPIILAPKNDKVSRRIIQNQSNSDIVVGAQADLTASVNKGFTIVAFDIGVTTVTNNVLYFTTKSTAPINAGDVRVFEELEA